MALHITHSIQNLVRKTVRDGCKTDFQRAKPMKSLDRSNQFYHLNRSIRKYTTLRIRDISSMKNMKCVIFMQNMNGVNNMNSMNSMNGVNGVNSMNNMYSMKRTSMWGTIKRFYSSSEDEVEDLNTKTWKSIHSFDIFLKHPKGWEFINVNENVFQFLTKRNHKITCQVFKKESKIKTASQGAQILFQQFKKSLNIKTEIGSIIGSEGDNFESFQLEFETDDKSHWIVSLDDERHQRILVFHYETPIDDYDKSLFIIFLSTINTKQASTERVNTTYVSNPSNPSNPTSNSSVEKPEVEIEDSEYEGEKKTSDNYKSFEDPFFGEKISKIINGIDFDEPLTSKNIDIFSKLLKDPEIFKQMTEYSRKMASITNEELEILRDTEEYKTSEEIRNFTEDYIKNRESALKHFKSIQVRLFAAKYIFPIIREK